MDEKNTAKNLLREGHRKRLRERFLQSGFEGFLDYEVVELLLTLGTPRRDCKQIAKEAIYKFKTLNNVLDASSNELQQIKGIGPANSFGIKLFQEISKKYFKANIQPKLLFNSSQNVYDYLREKIGKNKKENFVILCFDTRNNLIFDEVSVGTLNASLVHPREVFKEAILSHASHVIVAHNHPSGDPSPSQEDSNTTRRLIDAGKILGISIVDHIIITDNSYYSFRDAGFII